MGNCWWLHTKKAAGGGCWETGYLTPSHPPIRIPSTHPLGPKKMNETKYTIPYTHANPRVCVRVRVSVCVCVWMPSCCLAFSPWAWHMRLPT